MQRERLRVAASAIFVLAALLIGCSSQPENLTAEERQGYKVYLAYCRQCHSLQSPKLHRAEEWPPTVDRMKRYMKEKKKKMPSDPETEQLLIFLRQQARH